MPYSRHPELHHFPGALTLPGESFMSHSPFKSSLETPTHCSLGFQTHLLWVCLRYHGWFLDQGVYVASCFTNWPSLRPEGSEGKSQPQWVFSIRNRSATTVDLASSWVWHLIIGTGPGSAGVLQLKAVFHLRYPLQSQHYSGWSWGWYWGNVIFLVWVCPEACCFLNPTVRITHGISPVPYYSQINSFALVFSFKYINIYGQTHSLTSMWSWDPRKKQPGVTHIWTRA